LECIIGNYSIAVKRGHWSASEDISLPSLTFPYLVYFFIYKCNDDISSASVYEPACHVYFCCFRILNLQRHWWIMQRWLCITHCMFVNVSLYEWKCI